MSGVWLIFPFIGAIRFSTVLAFVVTVVVLTLARRSLLVAVIAAMGWVSARLGILWNDYDISLFADNLLNEDKLTPSTLGGRYGCRNADCSVFGSYYEDVKGTRLRPRAVGITATYRF